MWDPGEEGVEPDQADEAVGQLAGLLGRVRGQVKSQGRGSGGQISGSVGQGRHPDLWRGRHEGEGCAIAEDFVGCI